MQACGEIDAEAKDAAAVKVSSSTKNGKNSAHDLQLSPLSLRSGGDDIPAVVASALSSTGPAVCPPSGLALSSTSVSPAYAAGTGCHIVICPPSSEQ